MLPLLNFIILLFVPLSSSKFINSNNVSLTTELIPHIEENKSQKTYSKDESNFKRDPKEGHCTTNQIQPTNSSKTFTLLRAGPSKNEPSQERFRVYSKYGRPCMACPFRRRPSLKKALKHSYQALKLVLLPSTFSELDPYISLSTTVLSTLLGMALMRSLASEEVLEVLRKEWALQGEYRGVPIETVLKQGLGFLAADFVFRNLVLRPVLVANLFDSTFLQKVNWLGTNLESVDRGLLYKGFTAFSQGVTLMRIFFVTYIQFLMTEGNWNSASFLVDEKMSKKLSKLTFAAFLLSLFKHVMDLTLEGNLSGFLDLEFFLEPTLYKEKETRRAIYEELGNVYKNLPEFLRNLLSRRSRYLLNVYNFSKSLKFYSLTTMDWITFLLHISMALHSNSGAGVYLALLEYLVFGMVGGIEEVSQRLLAGKLRLTK